MYKWELIHKTSELKHLFKQDLECENTEKLTELWAKIYNEYLIEFGLSDNYKEQLELKKKIAKQQAEYLAKGDKMIINFINMDKDMLKTMQEKQVKSVSFNKSLISIEKSQGVRINLNEITVLEYYNYIKSLADGE